MTTLPSKLKYDVVAAAAAARHARNGTCDHDFLLLATATAALQQAAIIELSEEGEYEQPASGTAEIAKRLLGLFCPAPRCLRKLLPNKLLVTFLNNR